MLITFLYALIDMATFVCQQCGDLNSSSIGQAIDHVYSHRFATKLCVVPGCTYRGKKLTGHVKKSHPELCNFPCHLCVKKFVWSHSLQSHMRNTTRHRSSCKKIKVAYQKALQAEAILFVNTNNSYSECLSFILGDSTALQHHLCISKEFPNNIWKSAYRGATMVGAERKKFCLRWPKMTFSGSF